MKVTVVCRDCSEGMFNVKAFDRVETEGGSPTTGIATGDVSFFDQPIDFQENGNYQILGDPVQKSIQHHLEQSALRQHNKMDVYDGQGGGYIGECR